MGGSEGLQFMGGGTVRRLAMGGSGDDSVRGRRRLFAKLRLLEQADLLLVDGGESGVCGRCLCDDGPRFADLR